MLTWEQFYAQERPKYPSRDKLKSEALNMSNLMARGHGIEHQIKRSYEAYKARMQLQASA